MNTRYKIDIYVFLFCVFGSFDLSLTICFVSILFHKYPIVGEFKVQGPHHGGFSHDQDIWNIPFGAWIQLFGR